MGFSRGRSFRILSWSSYDLANQFFALNVISLYFPRWITIEKGSPEIFYSLAFGISMLLVAICAPLLGTISDITGRRRLFLIIFTLLSVIFTAALGIAGNVFLALLFFVVANFGCQGAIIFYNALLVNVAPKGKIGFVSGLGRMFGYCGAILALYVTKPVVLKMGYQPAFLVTAILFLIFALPCMIFVREDRKEAAPGSTGRESRLLVFGGLKRIYKARGFKHFLHASFFLLCAVSAVMLFMAVYAGKVFNLAEGQIIDLIVFSTLFAIIGSITSGFISDIVGYRRSLVGVFVLWIVCIAGGGVLKAPFLWLIGAGIGLSLGSTWVVLRALVIKLAPEENIGEAFGVFNLVGYLAGIVGPLFWGLILLYLSRFGEWGYRSALLSLILFIMVGFVFLLKMRKEVPL